MKRDVVVDPLDPDRKSSMVQTPPTTQSANADQMKGNGSIDDEQEKSEAAASGSDSDAAAALKAHSMRMESILSEGFSNITARFDQILTYTQHLPSIENHFIKFLDAQEKQLQVQSQLQSQLQQQLQLLMERSFRTLNGTNDTDIRESDGPQFPIPIVNDDFAVQLKTIASTALNISEALDGILDRFTTKDYRQPNYSCPNRNRGDYQFVGPKGFYSTCYYLAKNV